MKVGEEALLVVKWSNNKFTYYRVAKYREKESLFNYFTKLETFRFAILYRWNKKEKRRDGQIGYFDKHKNFL